MTYIKACPVKTSLKYIGKRWTLEIIRDIFFGKARFKEFLEANPRLTSKVLAQRLKELETNSIIKRVPYENSNRVDYQLTTKGYKLNRILYELAMFSYEYYQNDLFETNDVLSPMEMDKWTKKYFKISDPI